LKDRLVEKGDWDKFETWIWGAYGDTDCKETLVDWLLNPTRFCELVGEWLGKQEGGGMMQEKIMPDRTTLTLNCPWCEWKATIQVLIDAPKEAIIEASSILGHSLHKHWNGSMRCQTASREEGGK
jgi:hypothetical protein